MSDASLGDDRPRLVQLFVLVAVAVQLLPVWLTTRFPSQDGPAHLASSVAISGAFLYLGIWYFRRVERTFADLI